MSMAKSFYSRRGIFEASEGAKEGKLSEEEKSQYKYNAKVIAKKIFDRWSEHRVDLPPYASVEEHAAEGEIVTGYDIDTNSRYTNILYYIVRENLNDAIVYGCDRSAISDEVQLVSADEFESLFFYDIKLSLDYRIGQLLLNDSDDQNNKINDIDEVYSHTIDDFNKKRTRYYELFNDMIHGKFRNPDSPKPQYAINNKTHALCPGNTALNNAMRNGVSKQVAMPAEGSPIVGPNGTHAFVITDMMNDMITKISSGAAGSVYHLTPNVIKNIAVDILRFGLNSETVRNRYRLYITTSRSKSASSHISYDTETKYGPLYSKKSADGSVKQNGISFSQLADGPAFMTYDQMKQQLVCHKKLLPIMSAILGLKQYKTNGMLSLEVEPRSPSFARIRLVGAPEGISIGLLIDEAAMRGDITPIMTEGGSVASIERMGSASDGAEDTGEGNRTEAKVSEAHENLGDVAGKSATDNEDFNKYAMFIFQMTSGMKSIVQRIMTKNLGVTIPANVGSMNSTEASSLAVTIICALARLLSKSVIANREQPLQIDEPEITESDRETVKLTDNGRPLTKEELKECARHASLPQRSGEAKSWTKLGLSALFDKALDFAYGSTDTDATGSAVYSGNTVAESDDDIPDDVFEPKFMMYEMALQYADDGGNDEFGTLVSAFIADFASKLIGRDGDDRAIPPRQLIEYGMNCFGMNDDDGEEGDFYDESGESSLVQYLFDSRPGPRFRSGLVRSIDNQTPDRPGLIKDWIKYLNFIIDMANSGNEFDDGSDGIGDSSMDNISMTGSELISNYCRQNPYRLINAFTGKLKAYLEGLYGTKHRLDHVELKTLASQINMENMTPFVYFDPRVAAEAVVDSSGRVVGNANEFHL